MFRIPELLAPAGGMEQLRAAVENGADAVYMGGKLFNARINATNFSDAEMQEAIEYARLRGVRLYVTMNTLIKDSELSDALRYAAFLYEAGADALIIQDLGFAKLVREQIPDFELHLSTQGTVYNFEGVRMAKALGFSRVVLARELTLDEIREITKENLLEIEVFAHGALCICYSGQCQMSREIGGRSGNRGECAQPCRLPYSICRENEAGQMQEVSGQTFALSPKDLCTVEQLGRLAEAGVSSLKIEGRMKTPEYVAVVTGIYRKYLDLYAKHGRYQVEPSDLRDLAQIFSRGGFTEGYLSGNPGKNLMSGDLSKHQGIYIGKVVIGKVVGCSGPGRTSGRANTDKTGNGCASSSHSSLLSVLPSQATASPPARIACRCPFCQSKRAWGKKASLGQKGNRQRGLVTIHLAERLSVGDGVEIRNQELPGNLVTFMKKKGKKADSAEKGELVTVGYIDGTISPGDKVYKITDRELMRRAKASYEGKSGSAEKAMRKTDVSFAFSAGLDRPVTLRAADGEGRSVTKELAGGAEKSLTRATAAETVAAQLSKTGGTPFRVAECTVELEEGIAIPLSKINELRRAALEELEALRRQSGRKRVDLSWSLSEVNGKAAAAVKKGGPAADGAAVDQISVGPDERDEIFLYLYRVEKEERFDPAFSRIYVPYDAVLKGFCQDDDRIVPVIPNIAKGWHEYNIRKNFDKIVAASAKKGIAVGNPGWIEPFVRSGVNVFGDYGLNLYNSMDFLLARGLGIREAVISHEADPEDILGMDFHGIIPEAAAGGRIPVMTSAHCLLGDLNFCARKDNREKYFLKDRKGQFYPILTDPADCGSVILNDKDTNLLMKKEDLKKAGVKRFRIYAG